MPTGLLHRQLSIDSRSSLKTGRADSSHRSGTAQNVVTRQMKKGDLKVMLKIFTELHVSHASKHLKLLVR